MNKGILFVFSSPSGGGKTTIKDKILNEVRGVTWSISCTTREPRGDEKNGVDYYFLNEDDFRQRIKNDEFLEYADVFGNYYGTLRKTIEEQLINKKDIVLTIDVQGAMQIKKKIPAVLIFIVPPSFETLQSRLQNRNTDDETVIQQRLHEARRELSYAHNYDYLVINDTVDNAVESIKSIIYAERSKIGRYKLFLQGFMQ